MRSSVFAAGLADPEIHTHADTHAPLEISFVHIQGVTSYFAFLDGIFIWNSSHKLINPNTVKSVKRMSPVGWGCGESCEAGLGVALGAWLRPFSTGAGLGSLFTSDACSTPGSVCQTEKLEIEINGKTKKIMKIISER